MRYAAVMAMAALVAGCSKASEPEPPVTGIVFGLTSDFQAGSSINALAVHIEAGGVESERSFEIGPDKGLTNFPLEIPVDGLPDGTPVAVRLQGKRGSELRVKRDAATRVVGGKRLLFAVNLDLRCQELLLGGTDGGAPPCKPGETCIEGVCVDPFVAPSELVPYDPSWPATLPDPCKPPAAGKAGLTIGGGASQFEPMSSGALAQIIHGPQGGYHVWVSLRALNLQRRGTATTLTGSIPDVPAQMVGQFGSSQFSLLPQKDGSCTLPGMRLQIADDFSPDQKVEPLFGKKLVINASATDKDGATASDQRNVTLSNGFQ
jgi:hypothetical protein